MEGPRRLKASEKVPSGKPKADVAYREAEAALKQIAGQWRERFRLVQAARPEQEQTPTCSHRRLRQHGHCPGVLPEDQRRDRVRGGDRGRCGVRRGR